MLKMQKSNLSRGAVAQLVIFGIVGIIGFIADSMMLYLLKDLVGLYISRIFSFVFAVFVTWILNRNFTFKKGKRSNKLSEFIYYFGCMIVGGLANLTTYYLLIGSSQLIVEYPVIGVAIGSLAGMLINFVSSKWLVFTKQQTEE